MATQNDNKHYIMDNNTSVQSTSQPQQALHMRAGTATAVWLILVVATIVSWWVSPAGTLAVSEPQTARLITIIGLAVFKMYLIAAVFMGVAKSPIVWHFLVIAWMLITGGVLIYFVL